MKQHYHGISFVFSCLIIAGMTLDGWAHAHGAVDNTFFTPWHAILYTGLFGSTAWYGWLSRQQISPLSAHRFGFALLPIVALCGAADLVWHSLFGFELDISAQMSPPHIILASLIAALVALPSTQRSSTGALTRLGAVSGGLAATMMLTLTQFLAPISSVYAEMVSGGDTTRGIGVTGYMIFVAVWLIVLIWMSIHAAPRWSFTVASVLLGIVLAFIRDEWRFVPLLLLAALVVEIRWNAPHHSLRTIALIWTSVFGIGYIIILKYAGILMWGPTMSIGNLVMSIGVAYGISTIATLRESAAQGTSA